jgi:hypothetical protein
LNAAIPALTRRRDPERADCWRIHHGNARVGAIARTTGNPNAAECLQWSYGFYPGSEPRKQRVPRPPSLHSLVRLARESAVKMARRCGGGSSASSSARVKLKKRRRQKAAPPRSTHFRTGFSDEDWHLWNGPDGMCNRAAPNRGRP